MICNYLPTYTRPDRPNFFVFDDTSENLTLPRLEVARNEVDHHLSKLGFSTRGYLAGQRKCTIKMYARYVNKLFRYPDQPPPSSSPTLAHFIAYAPHRMRLTFSVTFAALYLWQRLKTWFIAARSSPGHRLFISAFMIGSKVICDDTYSNKSWCIVSQGMFALQEINRMEHEMCSYLEWQLNVEPGALKEFESMVRRDFKGPGPYPALPAPSSGPFAHPKPSTSNIPTAILSFGPGAPPSPPSSNALIPPEKLSRRLLADPYPTSADVPQLPTPPASCSNVPSPANSVSPATPPNYEGDGAGIVSSGGSNTMQIFSDNVSPPYHHIHARKSSSPIPAHTKTHSSIDTKHISPKRSSSGHQHIAPVKSNTVYASTRLCQGPFPKYMGSSKDWIATAQLQPSGALQATYWQKMGEKVEAAADLHLVNAPQRRDAVATLGLKYDLQMSTFRAQLDSTGSLCRGPFPLSLSVAIVT